MANGKWKMANVRTHAHFHLPFSVYHLPSAITICHHIMPQLIITAVGPDRPGIVGELSAHLHAAGANLLDSRMVNLLGEFAMMILLELSSDAAATKLSQDLPAVGEAMHLRLTVSPQHPQPTTRPVEGMPFVLKTYSMDQPGIVARLTAVLQKLGVNIEDLSARQESPP